jgi:hypothetical protein
MEIDKGRIAPDGDGYNRSAAVLNRVQFEKCSVRAWSAPLSLKMGRSMLFLGVGGVLPHRGGVREQLFGRMIVAADIFYWSVVERGEDRYFGAMTRVADVIGQAKTDSAQEEQSARS